jgi:hypothetical protein
VKREVGSKAIEISDEVSSNRKELDIDMEAEKTKEKEKSGDGE